MVWYGMIYSNLIDVAISLYNVEVLIIRIVIIV
jgi:hypothetical protein